MDNKYIIFVKLPDIKLTFKINKFDILETGHYKFYDEKTQSYRIYDSRICEIIEVNKNEL